MRRVIADNNRQDKMAACDCNVAGYILNEHAGRDFKKLVEMVQAYWPIVELQ